MIDLASMKLLLRHVYFQIIRLYYETMKSRFHIGYTYIHTYMNITSKFHCY